MKEDNREDDQLAGRVAKRTTWFENDGRAERPGLKGLAVPALTPTAFLSSSRRSTLAGHDELRSGAFEFVFKSGWIRLRSSISMHPGAGSNSRCGF